MSLDELLALNVPNIGVCDAIVREMPARPPIVGSDHAWYSPSSDQVGIPARDKFASSEEYYSTLFHELVHSTGHRSRLHREQFDNPVRFGSESYSKEELISRARRTDALRCCWHLSRSSG